MKCMRLWGLSKWKKMRVSPRMVERFEESLNYEIFKNSCRVNFMMSLN
jgi:hypothetical protein